MRIGLVVPGFSADAGDWCIPALRHLARALATADDLRVMAIRYPYRTARYELDGAQVVAVGGAARRGPGSLGVWRATLELLRHEHRRRPFDVLHAFWATESGLLTTLAGQILRVPTLVSLAGGELVGFSDIGYGDQRQAWERLKVRASLRLASAVSGGSRQLLNLAEDHVSAAKLRWAPLGVPLELFKPGSCAPQRSRRLVHVGTLTRVKDQATLLRAFARLRAPRPDLTLDIVGDGPLRSDLVLLGQTLGLAEGVCFRGNVDHAALPNVYASGTAFVLSSRHEAQGMVAVEAAACGLPVVGTQVGVVPELAISPAAVAPVGDSEALAGALVGVCDQPGQAASFAHARVREDFALDVCTARFRHLYASLADTS
jgi:glycosyltransferase involved in cell wall biosynthesis